jgi:hypothetical protein
VGRAWSLLDRGKCHLGFRADQTAAGVCVRQVNIAITRIENVPVAYRRRAIEVRGSSLQCDYCVKICIRMILDSLYVLQYFQLRPRSVMFIYVSSGFILSHHTNNLLRIREVPVSDLGTETCYHD